MNFSTFKSRVKSVAFPIGEAENLVDIHNTFIADALIEIQQYIPGYRESNVDRTVFTDTLFNCGLTVVPAPDGIIKRVYTVGGSDFCCKVTYHKSTLAHLRFEEAQGRVNTLAYTSPSQDPLQPELPLGDLRSNSVSDSKLGRALTGYWAVEGCRLYLWPHIESTEDVVVEWSGIKLAYDDSDEVFDDRAQKAVRYYLLKEVAANVEGNDIERTRYEALFDTERGTLAHWQRQKLEGSYAEEDQMPVVTTGCLVSGLSSTPVQPVIPEIPTLFAIIGDNGLITDGSLAVRTLVNSWTPQFIATTGGNNLTTVATYAGYDAQVGAPFHYLLFPYQGLYGGGSIDYNRYWPTVSAADKTTGPKLLAYQQFFGQPLYYDRIEGPLHMFFLDDTSVDGNFQTSAQAEWLRIKLSASIAPFKVVFIASPPYSSLSSNQTLRWPFKAWGATLVISCGAPGYERLVEDQLTYINNAAGGALLVNTFGALEVGSVYQSATNYGAIKGSLTCSKLKLEFTKTDGTVLDTVEVTHEHA